MEQLQKAQSLLDDVREKLTDNEYKTITDNLLMIYKVLFQFKSAIGVEIPEYWEEVVLGMVNSDGLTQEEVEDMEAWNLSFGIPPSSEGTN